MSGTVPGGAATGTQQVRPSRAMRQVDFVAGLAAVLAVRGGRRRRPVRAVDRSLAVLVDRVHRPCDDVAELELVSASGGLLPGWRPGAHVDVVLPSGRTRQYSLCGDPADRGVYRIAVRAIPGGAGSGEVHTLTPGTALTLRGPRNAFPFAAAPSFLFLAGGIGITPIAPMVRAAAAHGADWRLVHTGRDLDSMPLSAELAALAPERVTRHPDGGGPLSGDALLDGLPDGAAVYCCGPPPMIEAVRRAMPAGRRLHSERFSPPPIRDGRPFTVGIAGGPEIPVPADTTALDALRSVRPDLAFSCRQGFCGTCHVPLLAGETVDDPAGPGLTALCVGRAAGDRVVVDLPRR
ncbi:ferredoxin-NADP reductase [Pseudonocardia sediminis]|uniref:Ferredoxin-NADP reductase n=1 Tax=Pseudonocardia sediminis TaxID=1397368 RepID=A0A4Q7UVH0_PSEST|nr:PDR/VanB family oxidoreductase [Pseudonocardia sediminis]RZT85044.1 ferredoxin-NADP reductase [Pseudonocardia sediminis]